MRIPAARAKEKERRGYFASVERAMSMIAEVSRVSLTTLAAFNESQRSIGLGLGLGKSLTIGLAPRCRQRCSRGIKIIKPLATFKRCPDLLADDFS